MNDTTHMLFFVFRLKGGKKEVLLVRGGEENPDDWGFPIAALGKNLVHEKIEMVLKEKLFREIVIETVREIVPDELDESKKTYTDVVMYECQTAGEMISRGIGQVFFARSNNISGFNLSDRTSVVFHSRFIQSRLS
ncbi:MAG TPA: hypothetical protein VJH25_00225 [Candidatus Paceibacterota bacterium]